MRSPSIAKSYSIAGRVVSLVLAVELLAALCVTAFAFAYERHAHFRSFDIGLRGHADTVMGAVEDADDAKLGVMLDTTDLKLPEHDLFAVREEGNQLLGKSPDWRPGEALWSGQPGFFALEVGGHSYRGIRVRGVRVVDPMAANVRHPLTVLYAEPTYRVWGAVWGAVRVFALANGLLVLLTALLVPWIIRRSLAPLRSLASDASAISASSWRFTPTGEVRRVVELQPLVAALEGVIDRLERSFTQQRQFTGDAAHELKTAVAVVKSSIQLLELRARTAQEYEVGLQRCYADCVRMEELAQRMLLLARVEETAAEVETTSLREGVEAALTELAPFATLREVTLSAPDVCQAEVPMAAEALRSLLVNLLTNAVQHSPAGSVVRVTCAWGSDALHFQVQDCGEGIAAAALPYVFDRFYRGDASRSRKTGGTGLGLAICKAIVERAGGSIDLKSAPGRGTTVSVMLPALNNAPLKPLATALLVS